MTETLYISSPIAKRSIELGAITVLLSFNSTVTQVKSIASSITTEKKITSKIL